MIKKSTIVLTILYILCNNSLAYSVIPNFTGMWEGVCTITNPVQEQFKEILQISQSFSSNGEMDIIINDETYTSGEIETDVHSTVKAGISVNEITYTHWDAGKHQLITSIVKVFKLKNASRLSVTQNEWAMKLEANKLVIERKSINDETKTINCVYDKTKY